MSKYNGRFFLADSIAGLAIRLLNNQFLRARNAANSADINIWKINASDKIEPGVAIDMNSNVLDGLPDPTSANHAARRAYVDAQVATKTTTTYVDTVAAAKADTTYVDAQLATKASVASLTAAIQGLAPKASVRVATAAALPANTYSSGVLTATSNGALTVDGVSVSVGDRVLVKNESTAANNGIYDVTTVGSGGAAYVLTRSADAATGAQLKGAYAFAQEGTANADLEFLLATDGIPTVGTTALNWSAYGTGSGGTTYTAGNGISISGSTLAAKTQGAGTANTTGFDGSGNIKGLKSQKQEITLSGTDISNGYVDLSAVAHTDSISVKPDGGPEQRQAVDYTVSYSGGSGGVTRITFSGDLSSLLASSDLLFVNYLTL